MKPAIEPPIPAESIDLSSLKSNPPFGYSSKGRVAFAPQRFEKWEG